MSVEVTCFACTVHYTSPWFSDSYATSHVFSDLTMAKKFRHKLHKRMVFFQYAPSHVFSYLLTPKMFSHILHKRTVFLQYAPSHDFSDVPNPKMFHHRLHKHMGFPQYAPSHVFSDLTMPKMFHHKPHMRTLSGLCVHLSKLPFPCLDRFWFSEGQLLVWL
jgi:hypothetical protein